MLSWSTPEAEPLYLRIATLAAAELASGNTAAAARLAQSLADQVVNALEETDQSACAPGCGNCCVINVDILPPEAAVISAYLDETATPLAIEQLQRRLASLQQVTQGLDHTERIISQQPCAFLDENQSCIIHSVRPLLCRSVSSANAGDCRRALEMQASGQHYPIISRTSQREIYEAAFCGLAQGMETAGQDSTSGRLTELIRPHLPIP